MAVGQRYQPQFCNLDLHESLMPENAARFMKNLIYSLDDTATATTDRSGSTGVYKPLPSTALYIDSFVLPAGINHTCGALSVKEYREVYVFVQNSLGNHTIYRLNGSDTTYNIVYQGPELNFILQPEFFVHQAGSYVEVIFVTDPTSGQKKRRTFLFYTDGYNYQRFIAVEDSVATQSFNATLFPYFAGIYDKSWLINMGVPTPKDCIQISEIELTEEEKTQNNRLLFNTWEFRLRYIDVWGRPSEYGIISDIYIPGGNDCISASSGLPRCLNLAFDAPLPYIDKIEIAYRNCNDQQWYSADVLNLYTGSQLGEWWKRSRNPLVIYNSNTNKITYKFCADASCTPIAPALTNRLGNALPRSSQSLAKINKYINLANNKDGFIPFTQSLKEQITATVESPSDLNNTQQAFRNIEIYVDIYEPGRVGWDASNTPNEPIYQNSFSEGTFYGFGSYYAPWKARSFFAYRNFFPNPDQKGFIGYLAGTSVTTISEQWVLIGNTGEFRKATDFINLPDINTAINQNIKYFQKFTFTNVPAGKYIFRILSHMYDPRTQSLQEGIKSSTYVIGQSPFNFSNKTNPINRQYDLLNRVKELEVDVCSSHYNGLNDNKILTIWAFHANLYTVDAGYVKNTNIVGETQHGIELMKVTGGTYNSYNTDHNGFFFAAGETRLTSGQFKYQIFGFCNCSLVRYADTRSGQSDQLFTDNYFLDGSVHPVPACQDWENQPCNQIIIKGRVVLCNSDIGVPGTGVVLSRGNYTFTDTDGNFTLIAYDDSNTSIRQDKIYYITSSCSFTNCEGGCIEPQNVTIQKCITCDKREIDLQPVFVGFKSVKGLLSDATYPWGVVGWDWLGRPTWVQPLGNFITPSVQQTKNFSPSRIKIDISPTATFPTETSYITFWVSEPLNIQNYITWIVDKVEFIDNTGEINNDAPTQIKIRYASLVEYNKQNNFNTTTIWDFIPSGDNSPVVNDRVQFLINGDGQFFPTLITALVKYDATGTYFLINYTGALKDLQANAVIRLLRPKQCTTEEPYFEICSTINIVNRKASVNQFYLNAFDTYYIYRQIPVPTVLSPSSTVNQIRVLGIPFEHHSPSDFWGYKCHNIGRAHFKNPYETELFHEEEMALSGALSENGELNFLCFFDRARKRNFHETNINGITGVFPTTGAVLVIGQSDWFTVGFNDTVARINDSGQVIAPSITDQFGQPNGKVSNNYGCRLFDKNTLYAYKGLVHFLDSNAGMVMQHNYQQAIPISTNGTDSHIKSKVKFVQEYNLTNTNKRYFLGAVDCAANSYLLTDYTVNSSNFINTERDVNVRVHETVVYGIYSKTCKGWLSATPEYFCELESDIKDKQLFSFINGKPYRHYNISNNNDVGRVYGQTVLSILKPVIVIDNFVKKKPLSIGVLCKQAQFFADDIKTETGQLSRILSEHWLQAEFGWYAPFLCDLNTFPDANLPLQTGVNKILDGNTLVGNWISVRLVCKPTDANKYFELQGFVISVFKDGNNLLNK